MNKIEAETILKKIFGFESFYDNQWKVIDKLFMGKRILLIEKTGYGKSLCFQFPATQLDGTTIIFSPLISLMRDQLKKLNDLGIVARCINSEQTDLENEIVINEAIENKIKLLYIAPERMENARWLEGSTKIKISLIVIDEAHCISVWGHDFRPAYRRIINLVKLIPSNFPVLATTATATKIVEKDIMEQIGSNITSIRGNLIRKNFNLFVIKVKSEEEKFAWIGENIKKIEGTGIIYTGTRVNTEIFSNWLKYLNISSVGYNAGLDAETRIEIEDGLKENKWKCIVSTNALGMGIDKPDIRFIIHTQIPQSPIHYYQEIGRAGRDGKPTYLILFYNPEDKDLPIAFIDGAKPSINKYFKVIDILKKERLGEKELLRKTNLRQTQVRVIKADLIEQKIINEVNENRNKKYEYRYGASEFDVSILEKLRESKLKDLDEMINYAESTNCRMKFLCDYLGDESCGSCGKCDIDRNKIREVILTDEWTNKIEEFKNQSFPVLDVADKTTNLSNGVAASYYGTSNIGKLIHRCKYENGGDFPRILVSLTLKAFRQKFGNEKFDLILYVPSTESGNLVGNFAKRIADILKIPFSGKLIKVKKTEPQKIFQNHILKKENMKDAFILDNLNIVGKSILLFDDVYDSGATIKEIGKYLTKVGVAKITPIVIAKTIGGDIS
jgi:ATP-dependent DNA helicase RecQ